MSESGILRPKQALQRWYSGLSQINKMFFKQVNRSYKTFFQYVRSDHSSAVILNAWVINNNWGTKKMKPKEIFKDVQMCLSLLIWFSFVHMNFHMNNQAVFLWKCLAQDGQMWKVIQIILCCTIQWDSFWHGVKNLK